MRAIAGFPCFSEGVILESSIAKKRQHDECYPVLLAAYSDSKLWNGYRSISVTDIRGSFAFLKG